MVGGRRAGPSGAWRVTDSICWLCRRPLSVRVQCHHPVPKAKGGHGTVPVHPIGHRAIHANFTNAELVRTARARDALLASDALTRFPAWVADRLSDFHAPT